MEFILLKKEKKMRRLATISQTAFSVSPWLLMALAATAFTMVIIFYGVDSFAQGAHNTFHDFRHVVGMPCH